MNRKVLALILVIVLAAAGDVFAAARKARQPEYTGRNIPSDPALPSYDNPVEKDISKGKMHISFKGAFRAEDDKGFPNDWVYFAFRAKPQADMPLTVVQSELFDSTAKRYRYHAVPKINDEHAFRSELVAGVSVPVLVGVYMPLTEAGYLPSISRITITFNKENLEFRNVQVEEWATLEGLQEGL
ncbi:MAG: hypothetical protein IJR85_09240 [Synergistaceae bacterium]|nr:hypothetical protein [Synergistaceae bacterium]